MPFASEVDYVHGIPEPLRNQAAWLYESAFGEKFSVAVPNPTKRVALLAASFHLEHGFAAIAEERLVGMAGYRVTAGSLTGGLNYSRLIEYLGTLRGNWAAVIFSFFERQLQSNQLLMDGIAVHPDWRGKGIGSQLLKQLEVFAAQDYASIRLDVIDTNAGARRMYERNGYVASETAKFGYLRWLLGFGGATTLIRDVGSQPSV